MAVKKLENKYKDGTSPIPPSKGVLVCEEELCAGCMNCMFACSISHHGAASLELARLQMNVHTQAEFNICAQPCMQCEDPACLKACPIGAITIDEATGARIIQEEACIGCRACVRACPYEIPRIRFDAKSKKCSKCDLCGGDPECVKMCPTGALKYVYAPEGLASGYESSEGRK